MPNTRDATDTTQLRITLHPLAGKLRTVTGRNWTNIDMGKASGIHPQTIGSIASGKAKRLDIAVATKLLAMFRANGVACTISDIVVEGPILPPPHYRNKNIIEELS